MKQPHRRFIPFLLALSLASVAARADIVLQDDFESYAIGPLPTNNPSVSPWIHHSGNTTQPINVVGDATGASTRAIEVSQSLAADVHANLTNQPYSSAGTNGLGAPVAAVYSSFQIYVTTIPAVASGSQTYFAHFYQDSSTFKARLFIITNGAAPGSFRVAIQNGGTAVTNAIPLDLSPNTAYTLVSRYVPTIASSTVWVNPVNESSGNSATAGDSTPLANITAYGFRQNSGEGVIDVDNLKVGTGFADVVPGSVNPATIVTQPVDTNVFAGSTAVFKTLAVGDPTINYQWYYNTNTLLSDSGSIIGSTSNVLTLTALAVGQSGTYSCVASNGAGTNVTRFAVLNVSLNPVAPVITNQPQDLTVVAGDTATFTVVAGGIPAPSYQWKFVSGGVTNPVSGPNTSGTNTATLTLTSVGPTQAGQYFATLTNSVGSTNTRLASLTVQPPPFTNIAYIRTLQETNTWSATNTTALFTIQGIVTTWTNMTTSRTSTEFYLQDGTAGIAIFWTAADPATNLPPAGALVRVTGPMANFSGLLELGPVFTNSLHSVTVLSTNNPLPTPQPLPFDPNIAGNVATMERLEGSYFVASNVFLDLAEPNFSSAAPQNNEPITNNVRHVLTSGMFGLTFTNEAGLTFTFFVNGATDIPGRPKPTGPVTIYGILGDFTAAGYEFTPSRYVDIVPYTRSTNVLQNLTRFGDQNPNNFTESVLRPGESLTTFVSISDPEGGTVSLTPVTDGLPGSASWSGVVNGLSASAQFNFLPTGADVGSNYVVALAATTSTATTTNYWSIYVPTPTEQKIYITEAFSNPTTNAASKAFNPLQRVADTNNVAVNDQYVELANLSDTDVALDDLNGWAVGNGSSITHQFAFAGSSPILGSSNSAVVYGGPRNNDPAPPGLLVLNKPASSGALNLSTGGGIVTLYNGSGFLVDRVVYPASGFATAASRFPTVNSELVLQAYVSTNYVTPGSQYDGGAWNLATKVPTGITGVVVTGGNPVTLSFTANPNLATTLWQAGNLTDRFLVSTGKQFSATSGVFVITNPPPAQQFYFITTQ